MGDLTALQVTQLEPLALRQLATELSRHPDHHWTFSAALVGSVEDRVLANTFGFPSTRARAEAELGLSPNDTATFLRLWRLIGQSGLGVAAWSRVSKGKAFVIRRALHLGGDPTKWLDAALSSATEADLRLILQRQLGADVFIPFTIHMPESLVPLVQEAMRRALPYAVDEEIPADPAAQDEIVRHRAVQFRCLEVVCAAFLT